uniref:Uncharacterized protein n=1 Tax=Neogoniolithon spectabile TaxID=231755 RepID=A0A3G3MGP0_9FLOR|nr:hypothetical protein [Neogoniolithon spectabile]AYR05999.1 hypothetical protein [Neogoniolithon spectabile]
MYIFWNNISRFPRFFFICTYGILLDNLLPNFRAI